MKRVFCALCAVFLLLTACGRDAEPSAQTASSGSVENTCTVTVDCTALLAHPDRLNADKAAFVPESGYILRDAAAAFSDGETVFDVLCRVCADNVCTDNCRFCRAQGVQLESAYSPQFGTYYVEDIHQIYEKDGGGTSGWTYRVNGELPNVGASAYTVSPGDRIEWIYTMD